MWLKGNVYDNGLGSICPLNMIKIINYFSVRCRHKNRGWEVFSKCYNFLCPYVQYVCVLPCSSEQWWYGCQQGLCLLLWSPPNPPQPAGWHWSGSSGRHGSPGLAIFVGEKFRKVKGLNRDLKDAKWERKTREGRRNVMGAGGRVPFHAGVCKWILRR